MVFLCLGTITSCHNGTQFEGGIWVSNRIWSGPDGNHGVFGAQIGTVRGFSTLKTRT